MKHGSKKIPGFIDLQVNGYKRIDFSSSTLSTEDIYKATSLLVEAGTFAYLPTIVTCDLKIYERNLKILADVLNDKSIRKHILGIHLEGPFISPLEGARGAHPPEFIQKPSIELFKKFQDWARGNVKLITLAPEIEGAIELISYAVTNGVLVSMGHHLADDDVMERAVEAGALLATHLGNGLPGTINRHQNPLWWELACDKLYGMFITDGHHLPDDYIKVALRAKTPEKFLVVSDMSDLAGMPPGKYDFHGAPVTLAPSGRISFADTPYLAGSSAVMLQCINKLASLNLLSEKQLIEIGFFAPLKLLQIEPSLLLDDSRNTYLSFTDGVFKINTKK